MVRRRISAALRIACAAVVLGFCANADAAAPAPEWHVIKVGSRDYLPMDNVAKFYGLPTGVQPGGPLGKTLTLENGRIQLQVSLDSRECVIDGVRNWLSFPIIAKDGQFLISRVDLAKTVEPQLRPHMIPNLGKITTVVLDPGHGGFDKGACSKWGCEKDYVLDIGRQLKPLLEAKGLKVIMTRDSDVFIPLEERARIANSTRDSIFISLHLNATDWNPAAAGFEIYSLTPRGAPSTQDDALALKFFNMQIGSPVDAPSLALSMSIYHSVLGHLPEPDRGIKRARFAVLRLTKIPAVLVEGGFLTERNEGKLISNSEWRARYAQSISVGVENYKLLVEKRQRPMLLANYQRQLGGDLIAREPGRPPPQDVPVIPASNTQGIAVTAPPQSAGIPPAPSEQEQEEPDRAAMQVAAASSPSAAPQQTAAPDESTPPEEMPDASPAAAPVLARNDASPAPGASVEDLVGPPAHVQSHPAPAPAPAAAIQQPSFGSRILRWVPAIPPFL